MWTDLSTKFKLLLESCVCINLAPMKLNSVVLIFPSKIATITLVGLWPIVLRADAKSAPTESC